MSPKLIWTYIWWCPYCGCGENFEGKVCVNPKCMRPESALSRRSPIEIMRPDSRA